MSGIIDNDLATTWNVFLGIGRDWIRTIEFSYEANGQPFEILPSEVDAVVEKAQPLILNVAQGDAPNKIVLSATSGEVGDVARTTEWYVDIGGKRWFSGLWSVRPDTVTDLDEDTFTVHVATSTPIVAMVRAAASVGAATGSAFQYVHYQDVPSAIWMIEHNLYGYPAGIVVHDTSGNTIEGHDVKYIDTTTIALEYPFPFAGIARLS